VWVLSTQVHLMPFLNDGQDKRTQGNALYSILEASHPEMGKLEAALAGTSGFPSAMPKIPSMGPAQKLAAAARILDHAGYSLDVAGHITAAKGSEGTMWSTPYGLRWQEVTAKDILEVDHQGEVLAGPWDVTPAINIHTELHKARSDAQVIIHNHPYYGSLLAAMHEVPVIAEQQACMFDGDIVLLNEYTGGVDTALAGQKLSRQIGNATAIILANHGVLITGETIEQATYRAVTFERTCKLHYDALAANRNLVPVPPSTRHMLKRSLNTLSVNNFWRGEIRSLYRRDTDFFDAPMDTDDEHTDEHADDEHTNDEHTDEHTDDEHTDEHDDDEHTDEHTDEHSGEHTGEDADDDEIIDVEDDDEDEGDADVEEEEEDPHEDL